MDTHENNSDLFLKTINKFKGKYFKSLDIYHGKIYQEDLSNLKNQEYDMVISLGNFL